MNRREMVMVLGAGSEYFAGALGFIGPMQSLADTRPREPERIFILDIHRLHEYFEAYSSMSMPEHPVQLDYAHLHQLFEEYHQTTDLEEMADNEFFSRYAFAIEPYIEERNHAQEFADLVFREVSAKMRSTDYEPSLFLASQSEIPPFITRQFPRIPQPPTRVSKYQDFFRSRPRSHL